MTRREVRKRDVERIISDALHLVGLRVSILRVESTRTGWHVTVDHLISTDLPLGRPAAIRDAVNRWIDTWF